jgi:spermidine/putrescine transport system permease protein
MRIGRRLEALLVSPLALLLAAALIVPVGILLYYSFFNFLIFKRLGGATTANYVDAFTRSANGHYAMNTLWIALPTTIASVVAGYLLAYYIVFGGSRHRNLLFGLLVTALMASYLVRIYAWRTLLGETGIVNSALTGAGIIHEPLSFLLFSRTSVILAETTLFTPFAGLAFFAALSGIPPEFREVSRDLGAGRAQTLWRVTIPLSGRAILAVTAVVFFLSASDYITPTLVGSLSSQTIGYVIASYFGEAAQYGLGAALSFVTLMAFLLAFFALWASLRATRVLPRTAGAMSR